MNSERDTYRDDGSTASTAVLVGKHLYVANVGDSRTVISKAGRGIAPILHHDNVVCILGSWSSSRICVFSLLNYISSGQAWFKYFGWINNWSSWKDNMMNSLDHAEEMYLFVETLILRKDGSFHISMSYHIEFYLSLLAK